MSYSFSDGCGSCSTVGGFNEMPANQVNFVDPGTQMVSQLVMAQQQAQKNAMNSQSMHQQEQQMIDAQVINSKLADAFSNTPNTSTQQIVRTQQQQAPTPVQQEKANLNNANVQKNEQPKHVVKKEQNEQQLKLDLKTLVMVGLIIVIALGWNETAKYHINQAIKYNDGSPYYYAGYVIVMILLAFVACNYFKKN